MKTFKLTKDHLKLLRAMWVTWEGSESGAPMIDCKRPYGNSYVAEDIHFILTGSYPEDMCTDKQEAAYRKLHEETETALQIVLSTGKFKPGKYLMKEEYGKDWIFIGNK